MMEKVIYENGGGLGVILINEKEEDFILKKDISLHNEIIQANSFTDLDGRFIGKIRYAGVLIEDESIMCFHAGDDEDIFEHRKYYYCYHRIDENTIANKYRESTARDFKWINGKWK